MDAGVTSVQARKSLFAALLLAVLGVLACAERPAAEVVSSCRLPVDFGSLKEQLDELEVNCGAERVRLSGYSIRRLRINGASLVRWDGLPAELESLEIIGPSPTLPVRRLPSSLRALSVQWHPRYGQLPASLRDLTVQGQDLRSPKAIPPRTRHLRILDTSIENLVGMSGTVESLTIRGSALMSLKGIPGTVVSLELEGTEIPSLDGLPLNLKHLALRNNGKDLVVDRLPARLSSLVLHGYLRQLPSLKLNTPALAALDLKLVFWDADDLPSFVTRLRLAPSNQGSLASLSGNRMLEYLDLPGYDSTELVDLPPNLRFLGLSFSSIVHLPQLPKNLEGLDISGVTLDSLEPIGNLQHLRVLIYRWTRANRIGRLPRSLERLSLKGARHLGEVDLTMLPNLRQLDVSDTGIRELPDLPASLIELDISNSYISRIRSYPPRLESLTLHHGQLGELGKAPSTLKSLRFVNADQR